MLNILFLCQLSLSVAEYIVQYYYNLDINQTTFLLTTILPEDAKYVNCQYILTLGSQIQCQNSFVNINTESAYDEFNVDCSQNIFTIQGQFCYYNFTVQINNFTGPYYNISIDSTLDIYYFDGSQYQFDQKFQQKFAYLVQEYQIQSTSSSKTAFELNDMIFNLNLQINPVQNGSQIQIIFPQSYNPNIPLSIYDHFDLSKLQCFWIQGQQQLASCQYTSNVLTISNYIIPMLGKPLEIAQVKLSGYRNSYIVQPQPLTIQATYQISGNTYYGFKLSSTITINNYSTNTPTITLSTYGTSAQSAISLKLNVDSYLAINNQIQIKFQENPQFSTQFDLQCNAFCSGFTSMLTSNNIIQFSLTESAYQENVSLQFTILNFINPSTNNQYSIQITLFEQIGSNKYIVKQGQSQITFTQNTLQNIQIYCLQCYFGQFSSYRLQLVAPIVSTSSSLIVTFPSQLFVQPETLAIRITDNYYIQIKQDNQKIQIDGLFLLSNFNVIIDLYDILNPLKQEYDYQFQLELINQNTSIIKQTATQNISYSQFPMYALSIVLGDMILPSYKTNLIIEIESRNNFLRNETLQILFFSQCYIENEQELSCQISNIQMPFSCSLNNGIIEISLANQIEELKNLQIFISQISYPRALGTCTLQFQTISNNQIIKQSILYDLQVKNVRTFKQSQIYLDSTNYIIDLLSSQNLFQGEKVQIKIPNGLNIQLLNNYQGLEIKQQIINYVVQNNGSFNSQIRIKISSIQNYFNQIFQVSAYDNQSRLTQQSYFQLEVQQMSDVQQILFEIKPTSYSYYEPTSYKLQLSSPLQLPNSNYMVLVWSSDIDARYYQIKGYKTSSNWIDGKFNLRLNVGSDYFISDQIIEFDKIMNPKQTANSQFEFQLKVYNSQNILIASGQYNLPNTFACYQNCKTCLSQSFCQECQVNYFLYNNQCQQKCPQQYFPINRTCQQCPILKGCKQCNSNNPNMCFECSGGYILINGICSAIIQQEKSDNNQQDISGAFLITYLQILLFLILTVRKFFRRNMKFLKTFWIIQEFQVIILEKVLLVFLLVNSQYQFFFIFISIIIIDQIQMIIGQQVIKKFVQFNLILQNQASRDNVAKLFQFLIYFYNWRIIYIFETSIFDRRCFNFNLSQFQSLFNQIQQFTYIFNYIQSPLQLSVLLYILISGYQSTYQIDYTIFFIFKTLLQTTVIIMDQQTVKQVNTRIFPEDQYQ